MRVLAPWNTQSPIVERSSGLGLVGALAIFAVFIALRVYCAFTLSMNSDEPQHLHVVWAWTQGQVPYCDVFDNHAPLFQLISAPLFALLGERADIVALMRLAMLPLYLGALASTWYIARVLWSPRVAWVAAILAASSPIFFIVSIQYRDIDERLAATGTPLVILDRLPERDVAFIRENYVAVPPVSRQIYIPGRMLGHALAGAQVVFEVRVPTDYAIVTPSGSAVGLLDGEVWTGPRRLALGRHVFVPSADSRLAVVWAPALQRGLQSSELFTAIDR